MFFHVLFDHRPGRGVPPKPVSLDWVIAEHGIEIAKVLPQHLNERNEFVLGDTRYQLVREVIINDIVGPVRL